MAINWDKSIEESLDHTSRGAKLRLFAALAGVMLVLAVGERLLDPDFRQWLAGGPSLDAAGGNEIDTRLPPRAVAAEPDSFVAAATQPPPTGWDEALARVEDDTLHMRPAESAAWQLIEERLESADPAELRRQSLGVIGYTQLFQQPEVYRGKVITVRGTVKYASRASERYALWIMPHEGPTSPIVVYATEMPLGFPPIERLPGGQLTRLNEAVTIHGIVLKRGSYHAQDGPRSAPVVLAKMPEWTPAKVAAATSSRYGLTTGWLWPTAAAAFGLAIAFVALAHWYSIRKERQGRGPVNPRLVAADFRGVSISPSTAEVLREIEQREK